MMHETMNYITKGIGGFYYVRTEEGIVECKARGIFRKRGISPVAGDNVVLSPDKTMIDEILPRKNVFYPSSGGKPRCAVYRCQHNTAGSQYAGAG